MIVLIRTPISASRATFIRVDDVELQLLVDDLLLHLLRQLVPDFVGAVGAVQQERRARLGDLQACRSVRGS